MIRLQKISLREIRLPLVDPFRASHGSVQERRVLLLQLRDHDGLVAWSECVAQNLPGYTDETVDNTWLALTGVIIPAALRQKFESAEAANHPLKAAARDNRMARASVEMGLWAIEAYQQGVSLASVLTSASSTPTDPRRTVTSGIALGMQASPDALSEQCTIAIDQGYRRVKIKIEPGRDVEYVKAAQLAVSARADVSVDANGSYASSQTSSVEALDDMGLAMIEQPLGKDAMLEHAQLQQKLKTPLCLDESITSRERTDEMIALASARIVNLKPGRVGGFTESIAIHDGCIQAGIPLWCGGMLETGIGRAYNIALASLPGFTLPGDLSPSSRYWKRDIVKEPWKMDRHGNVQVPLERSGIGVDIDEAFVDELTARRVEVSAR